MKKVYQYHPIAHPVTIFLSAFGCLVYTIFGESLFIITAFMFHLCLVSIAHWNKKKCKVTWQAKQQEQTIFSGEKEACSIIISNESSFPITNGTFSFQSNAGLTWTHPDFLPQTINKQSYQLPFSLKEGKRHSFSFGVEGQKRGKHSWIDSVLQIKEPLQLITILFYQEKAAYPIYQVYPSIKKVTIPDTKEWRHGYRKAFVSPLYDESKMVGVKKYEQESFRAIHWGATAKIGELLAKKYDFTQSDKYAVLVNLAGIKGFLPHPNIEELIEIAVGTCKQLVSQDCSFEIWVNCNTPNGLIHLKQGQNRKQLQQALILFSAIPTKELNFLSTDYFYSNCFRNMTPEAIPITIGYSPLDTSRKNNWIEMSV